MKKGSTVSVKPSRVTYDELEGTARWHGVTGMLAWGQVLFLAEGVFECCDSC